MDLGSWRSQLRKGAAELAVLAVLSRRQRYGLEILQEIVEEGLEITEGTLYPLLNRLQRDGKITAQWVEDEGASHPRKYYRLTAEGTAFLQAMSGEWATFSTGLSRLIKGDAP